MTEQLDVEVNVKNEKTKAQLKETRSLFSDLGQGFKEGLGIAAGLGGVELARTMVEGVTEFVKMAMEAEAIQADLQAVLKSTKSAAGLTADEINRMATSLSLVTKYEDDSIVKGQSMLLTFTNIGKDVFPQATESMLDMAQKFGYDLPQAAIVLGKALNDPIAGVGALRRIGVQLTDEQKTMIEGFVETGNMAAAQKVILGELQTELGGVAKAYGETAAGQIEIFNNKVGNTKEAIGTGLLPTLTGLLDKVTLLTGGVTGNNQSWTDLTATIASFMATPLGAALDNANTSLKALNSVADVFKGLLRDLGIGVKSGTNELNLWNVAWNATVNVVKTLVGGPLVWIKAALDGIASAIREIKALDISAALDFLSKIRGYASGGIVPGPLGAPMLAVVHGGEVISQAGTTNYWQPTFNYGNAPANSAMDVQMMRFAAGA